MLEQIKIRAKVKQPWHFSTDKLVKIPILDVEPKICNPEHGSAQMRLFEMMRDHNSGEDSIPLYLMSPEKEPVKPQQDAVKMIANVETVNGMKRLYRGKLCVNVVISTET